MENNSTSLRLPPSPTDSTLRARGFNVWFTIAFALGAIALALCAVIGYLAYAVTTGSIDLHQRRIAPVAELYAELAIYAPVGIYILIFLPVLANRSLHDLGIRVPGWREIAIGIGGAILMFLAVDLVGFVIAALTHRQDTEAAIALLKQLRTPTEKILFVSIAVIFAPLLEELGFRVFLFNAFARYAPASIAALLSGIVFGLAHSASPWQLVTIGVPLASGGVVLALVYTWSRCYWSNVITHTTFNAVPLFLYFKFHIQT